MKYLVVCLLAAAACGGGESSSDLPDATPFMYTVGGTTTQRTGLTAAAVSDVAISVYDQDDEQTVLATTMTDAMGKFTLTYNATKSIEIVLKGTKTGFVTSYFYPAEPVGTTLRMFPIDMMSTANHTALHAGSTADPTKGTVELTILSSNSTVAGATVATQPAGAAYKYNDANGQPSSSASSTALDGIGYALNVPPGMVTINANKAGIMLKKPSFVIHADALNQAVVTP